MKTYKFEVFTTTIEKNILEGIYKPGYKLPSVRELKEQYKTSISTIQNGYEYLVISGLVESVPKSGYYVSNRPDIVSPIYQETVNKLLTGTSYDRHLRTLRLQLAKNAYFTTHLIAENFPDGTQLITPTGGYNLWVKMPDHIDMTAFYEQCEKIGVRFTPGYTFSFSGAFSKHFRLVFADKFSSKRIESLKQAGRPFC